MEYKLTFVKKPAYLHAIVTGENSRQNVEQYLLEVLRECEANKYRKVLIEERLEGPRLRTMDVFKIASDGAAKGRAVLRAIAYVDVNAGGDTMKFAETVAVNRSLPVSVFPTVAEAEKWLQAQDRG
jgi:hypothetical protein